MSSKLDAVKNSSAVSTGKKNIKSNQKIKCSGAFKNNPSSGNSIETERHFGGPESNESLAVVEYHKTSTTSMRIMADDVQTRSAKHKSYDLHWYVPGQGVKIDPKAGVACQLRHTVYTLENITDYTLYVRMQRPMGYKTAPSVIGMWEPLGTRETKQENAMFTLRPRSQRSFSIHNVSTTYMTSRHVMKNGKVAVHLASLSLFRDVMNDHGNKVAPEGVAVTLTAETHFRVNDGKVGTEKGYVVETFSDSSHLDVVSAGPPVCTMVSDTTTKNGQVDCLVVDRSNNAKGKTELVLKGRANGIWSEDVSGLDTTCWYRLPVSAVGKTTNYGNISSNIASYDAGISAWKVGFLLSTTNGAYDIQSPAFQSVTLPDNSKGVVTVLVGTDKLSPVSLTTIRPVNTIRTSRKTGVRKVGVRVQAPESGFVQLETIGVDTILDSIVMIVDVVRVVAAFAAAIGFLADDSNIVKSTPGGDNISSY